MAHSISKTLCILKGGHFIGFTSFDSDKTNVPNLSRHFLKSYHRYPKVENIIKNIFSKMGVNTDPSTITDLRFRHMVNTSCIKCLECIRFFFANRFIDTLYSKLCKTERMGVLERWVHHLDILMKPKLDKTFFRKFREEKMVFIAHCKMFRKREQGRLEDAQKIDLFKRIINRELNRKIGDSFAEVEALRIDPFEEALDNLKFLSQFKMDVSNRYKRNNEVIGSEKVRQRAQLIMNDIKYFTQLKPSEIKDPLIIWALLAKFYRCRSKALYNVQVSFFRTSTCR